MAIRKQSSPPKHTDSLAPKRANRIIFFDLAYERIEERLINCELKRGMQLTLGELQDATGLGRTPVHSAVSQLAADTLFIVLPRHGLKVAPIDLGGSAAFCHYGATWNGLSCEWRSTTPVLRTAISSCIWNAHCLSDAIV